MIRIKFIDKKKLLVCRCNCRCQYCTLHRNSQSKPIQFLTVTVYPVTIPNDCISVNLAVKLLNFDNDPTVIGLIQDNNESAYIQEVEWLVHFCSKNHLDLSHCGDGPGRLENSSNTPLS
ncbi:hypothetical protein AMECASPLE_033553 [Ameca splendens]|uniref:Uncharacterized protein n=1 Tax=Ameca splendens TaxID=208324 RepID=A0ABV0ZFN7_9TELE